MCASAAMVDTMQVASITPDILTDNSREVPGHAAGRRASTCPTSGCTSISTSGWSTPFRFRAGEGSYGTPTGRWNAYWLSPKHRSRKYNNAPMPWAVFFNEGYAVHGTTDLRNLGRPASHGCIRLHPEQCQDLLQTGSDQRQGKHADLDRALGPAVRYRSRRTPRVEHEGPHQAIVLGFFEIDPRRESSAGELQEASAGIGHQDREWWP